MELLVDSLSASYIHYMRIYCIIIGYSDRDAYQICASRE